MPGLVELFSIRKGGGDFAAGINKHRVLSKKMYMTTVSIIVPVYNEEANVGAFLRQLRRVISGSDEVELLVVDGGSSDDTVRIVESSGAVCLESAPGRARQMNFASAHARGRYLLFLHCDTILPDTFLEVFFHVVASQAPWGFFRLRLTGTDPVFRIIERAISWRSNLVGIGTGDQAVFVRRDVWRNAGGYGELALMEDIDLCRRLRRRSRPAVIAQPVTTSSRRWERHGVLRTVLLMWYLRACFYLGVNDKTLARWYR